MLSPIAYLLIIAGFDARRCGRQRYPMNITRRKGADDQLAQALLIVFLTPIGSEICSIWADCQVSKPLNRMDIKGDGEHCSALWTTRSRRHSDGITGPKS
jgi:hypothetical protein